MALMSCGPAFLALVVEAMADAGPATAWTTTRPRGWWWRRWPAQPPSWTPTGSTPPACARRVATPGGLTEKGLRTLEEAGLRDSFDAAVDLVVEESRP